MRNIKTLLCAMGLVCTTHGVGTLLAATTPQVIVLGEVVHGTAPPSGPSLLFELTALSDGWVAVSLNWDPQQGALVLFGDAQSCDLDFTCDLDGTIEVLVWMVAGQTYGIWVGPALYDFNPLDVSFVLTTTEPASPPPPPPPLPPAPVCTNSKTLSANNVISMTSQSFSIRRRVSTPSLLLRKV